MEEKVVSRLHYRSSCTVLAVVFLSRREAAEQERRDYELAVRLAQVHVSSTSLNGWWLKCSTPPFIHTHTHTHTVRGAAEGDSRHCCGQEQTPAPAVPDSPPLSPASRSEATLSSAAGSCQEIRPHQVEVCRVEGHHQHFLW